MDSLKVYIKINEIFGKKENIKKHEAITKFFK